MKILGNSRGVATVLAIAVGLAVVPASAQTTPPPAKPATAPAAPAKPADPKALVASGQKKFKASDVAGALADFEAANAAAPSPETDRWIGQCHDSLGHFAEAVAAYERFLAKVPPKMKSEGEEVTKRVAAIKAMPGKVHIEVLPAGAQLMVDPGGTPPPAPMAVPADLDLAPGHHVLRFAAEGYAPVDKELDVTFGSRQDLRVELTKNEPPPPPAPAVAEVPPPTPAPAPPPPPQPRSKVPAYVTGGVAVVALGFGTAFGIKALSQSSDFNDRPTTQKADDGENNALIADMMFGVAITFGVTSAVLFLSDDTPQASSTAQSKSATVATVKKPSKITITPTPYVTPSGGGAGALIRF